MSTITLSRSEMHSVLKLASTLTKWRFKRCKLNILQCVTLEINFTRLFIRACNLESHLGTCLNAMEPSPTAGEAASSRVVVNALALRQMIEALRGDRFTLRCVSDAEIIVLDQQGHETAVHTGFKIEGFPVWKGLYGKPIANMKLADLARLLGQVAISVAKESSQFAVAGVHLKLEKGLITATAIDGSRMSKATVEADVRKKGEIVIPSSAVKLLAGLADRAEIVEIRLEDGSACFSWGMNELLVKGIEAKFPDTDKLIPKSHSGEAKIKKRDLEKALEYSRGGGRKAPPTLLKFQERELFVTSVIKEAGSKREDRIPIEFTGEQVEVSVNARFLNDFLGIAPSEELLVKLGGPGGAIWMAGARQPERCQYVFMPVTASAPVPAPAPENAPISVSASTPVSASVNG